MFFESDKMEDSLQIERFFFIHRSKKCFTGRVAEVLSHIFIVSSNQERNVVLDHRWISLEFFQDLKIIVKMEAIDMFKHLLALPVVCY